MKRIYFLLRDFFASNYAFFLVVTSVLVLASFVPFLYLTWLTPPGHVYLGAHNFVGDYAMYPAGIIQGQHLKLTSLDKFTAEPQTGTWVHGLYLWLGWLTAPFRLNPVLVYHLARLAGGFLFALAIFVLIRQFFEKAGERNLAFLLAYAISSIPHLSFVGGKLALLEPYLPWWSGGEVMRRVTFLPHSLMRDSLLLLIFAWWIKVLKEGRVRFLPAALAAGFLLSFFGPLQAGLVWLWLALGVAFVFFQEVKTRRFVKTRLVVKTAFLYFLFSLPSFLYIVQVFSINPWKWVKEWELANPRITPFWEWAAFSGVTFFLALPGMILVLARRGLARILLLAFILVTMAGIFSRATSLFGLISFRFLGVPLHVPFGIFAADTLSAAQKFFRLRFLALIVALFLLLLSLPAYIQSIDTQIDEYHPRRGFINVYLPQAWYDSMRWLDENTDPDEIVLSEFVTGNTIPAVSGNTTYIGHFVSTLNLAEKAEKSDAFFSGGMGQEEARQFLLDNRIDYVFHGAMEWPMGVNPAIYPFLEKIFENEAATIYKFKN